MSAPACRDALFRRRLDGRGFVDDFLVVQQQQRPFFGQGKTLAVAPVEFEDAAFAAANIFPPGKQDGDEIGTVAVRPLRGRSSDAIGGVDTELVRFHMPGLFSFNLRTDPRNGLHQFLQPGLRHDPGLHRFKQAQHAAMQCIVFQRLVMRAMRNLLDIPGGYDEAGVPAAAIMPAVLEEVIRRQIVPVRLQRIQRGQGKIKKGSQP